MTDDVYIAGIGMTALGKFPQRSVKQLTQEAVAQALSDAGLAREDIQAAWFSNTRQALLEGQNTIRGQCALRAMGFEGIPIANIENACASGSTALLQAYAHIRAGLCDIALVVGAEKMFFPEKKAAMLQAFMGGTDIHTIEDTRAGLAAMAPELIPASVRQPGAGEHSFFMDMYAAFARLHMQTFGTTQRQLAAVAAKNHWHSTMNPLSQYQHDMTVDEVLADKLISWPFTRSMCAPISDGAAAAVICGERVLSRFRENPPVRIAGISLVSGTRREPTDYANHLGRRAAFAAYEQAGIGPQDVDVVELHDASAFAEIQQVENLGLCDIGEGGAFAESGATRLGGKVPVNPSGGLVSKGHPVGATGVAQLVELTQQLRGQAGKRQVEGARVAVAENGGGFYEVEEAATVVTVLSR
ncbi:thiolase family protein [Parahaliea mediterranea]|uniref:propanoyl-CoA C-acyltransferase n=1 Tax=Parahaliea mediterranea TaxID=651086 RepID=A0A939DHP8_9GAMM|nr:thiolase family protein [Parahaliea mediterranea]MBN7798223.1 thiolase family protein [Parahaliea mediterranea]